MKRGGCKFGDGKPRGCHFSKKGDCSFAVGSQAQRVSAPPPPPRVTTIPDPGQFPVAVSIPLSSLGRAVNPLTTVSWPGSGPFTLRLGGGGCYSSKSLVSTVKLIEKAVAVNLIYSTSYRRSGHPHIALHLKVGYKRTLFPQWLNNLFE